MVFMILSVLSGIPASGKSTLSKQLADKYNAKRYCFDDIPESRNSKKSRQAHHKFWDDISKDLTFQNVVCDDLNVTIETRQLLLEHLSDVECRKIIYVMTTPLEECLKRNNGRQGIERLPEIVIRSLHSIFELPTLSEGWDEIIYI